MIIKKNKKLSLENIIFKKMISGHREICSSIRKDFSLNFDTIPGSSHNHQNWKGGYRDHVEEIMNIACVIYKSLNNKRKLNFSLSKALFLLFLHDMDKIFRYKIISGRIIRKNDYSKSFVQDIKMLLKNKYKYSLSSIEINALTYVHGEGKDYSSKKRVMGPLATFIHCCDVISARIWFNKGRDEQYW